MKNYFKNLTNTIEEINTSVNNLNNKYSNDPNDKKDMDVVDNMDFELAKAFILDNEGVAIKVAKMILAHENINDVKVKFE